MSASYRDPNVIYRQPGVSYRGLGVADALVPTVDLERKDYVEIRTVTKYGVRLADLSASIIGDVEWKLNDVGVVTVDASTEDPTIFSVEPGHDEVQIVFTNAPRQDGTPEMWWGHFRGDDAEPGKMAFQLDEIQSMLQERIIETDALNRDDEFEQFDIAWDLINHAQTGDNMDLHITRAAVAGSGITRVRHYVRDQHSNIYDELKAFTNLQNGFDWWVNYDLTGQKVWTPAYPQRGVQWPRENLVFEWGLNIVGYKRRRDLRRLITRYWAGGGSDGAGNKLEQSYEDFTASELYGVRAKAGSDGAQESSAEWLLAQAMDKVNTLKKPLITLTLAVTEMPFRILGVIHVGDSVWVDIDDGAVDVHGYFRIIALKWLAGGGIDLTFQIV